MKVPLTCICTTLFTPDTPSSRPFDPMRDLNGRSLEDYEKNKDTLPAVRRSTSTIFFGPNGFVQHYDDGRVLQVVKSRLDDVFDTLAGAWTDMDFTANNRGLMRTSVFVVETGQTVEGPVEHVHTWTWGSRWTHSETCKVWDVFEKEMTRKAILGGL